MTVFREHRNNFRLLFEDRQFGTNFNTCKCGFHNRLHHDFGIQSTSLDWFSPCLTNRNQFLSINCYISQPASISFGVPPGSVLGPVLFVLYTAPLSTATEKHSVHHHTYTDDSQLKTAPPPHQIPDLFLCAEMYR